MPPTGAWSRQSPLIKSFYGLDKCSGESLLPLKKLTRIPFHGLFKTGYFYLSRGLLVADADRRHKQAVEKLKESYEFADWSHREREKQLPELTPEQRRQMNNFLHCKFSVAAQLQNAQRHSWVFFSLFCFFGHLS